MSGKTFEDRILGVIKLKNPTTLPRPATAGVRQQLGLRAFLVAAKATPDGTLPRGQGNF
jgi:hypothetical protein